MFTDRGLPGQILQDQREPGPLEVEIGAVPAREQIFKSYRKKQIFITSLLLRRRSKIRIFGLQVVGGHPDQALDCAAKCGVQL